jgi:hypothetical protein
MRSLDFLQNNGGRRLERCDPQPLLEGEPADDYENDQDEADQEPDGLDFELGRGQWEPISLCLADNWRPRQWPMRPVRFIDGKDVGETIALVRSPEGLHVPIRLSQVGGIEIIVTDEDCRRGFHITDRTVSLATDLFNWDEIESFGAGLQLGGFRLLPAALPKGKPLDDFEVLRKATQNRTNDEMRVLEEAALAQRPDVPSIVDGLLEPHRGGFDPATSPVFGVVKTHRKYHLHSRGMRVLYELAEGQRTPIFVLTREKESDDITKPPGRRLPVVSWYVRLAGGSTAPNLGLVRVEVAKKYFDSCGCDRDFVDRLSQTIYVYRCREQSYDRAAVSLHPIVRAEQKLGALFIPNSILTNRFYRLTGL